MQTVHHQGCWVALLVWGPAALKLADRDEAIGWTDSQRAERIGLIVQNRRFLVPGKIRMPDIASRALGLTVKALPAAWEQAHGYRPLLTETFTGIEQFAGTCYEAAGVGSRAASPRAHPRTPRRFPLPLLPPRPELPRSLQPASQNRPPRVRRRTHRMTGRRPRHPAARTRHRWQIRAQPRTDSLSERTRERRARRHRRPGLRDEDTKKEGELTASRRLHATTPLHGAIVTGDAINCERKSTMLVVENGADFVFHLRDNQPTAPEHAMAVAARLPALPAKQSICATVG